MEASKACDVYGTFGVKDIERSVDVAALLRLRQRTADCGVVWIKGLADEVGADAEQETGADRTHGMAPLDASVVSGLAAGGLGTDMNRLRVAINCIWIFSSGSKQRRQRASY